MNPEGLVVASRVWGSVRGKKAESGLQKIEDHVTPGAIYRRNPRRGVSDESLIEGENLCFEIGILW